MFLLSSAALIRGQRLTVLRERGASFLQDGGAGGDGRGGVLFV